MSKDASRQNSSPDSNIKRILPEGSAFVAPSFSTESRSATGFRLQVPAGVVKLKGSELDATTIAERIIDFCHEHGDFVSNLKLQKLLYYCQAWYLALHGEPLFHESFQAWPNGPVQPDAYKAFHWFGDKPIEKPRREWKLPKNVEQHISDLIISYGRLSAFELERLSCQEEPWREARRGLDPDESSDRIISTDTMKRYYKSRLNEQSQGQN